MNHDGRCTGAKSPPSNCHCKSCHGKLHGTGRSGAGYSSTSTAARTVSESIGTGAAMGLLAPLVPGIGPFLTVYFFVKMGVELYTAYKEEGPEGLLTEASKKVVSHVVSEQLGSSLSPQISNATKRVVVIAQEHGIVQKTAQETGVDETTMATMFEASINEGIKEGIDSLSEYVVEEAV